LRRFDNGLFAAPRDTGGPVVGGSTHAPQPITLSPKQLGGNAMADAAPLVSVLPPEMKELRLRPLFLFELAVKPASVIGKTPGVDRRVGEITGGRFEGERLRGKILSGGSDWQAVRADGAWMLDVRCVMETDDGALIGMTYRGIRHGPKEVLDRIAKGEVVNPALYYMRATPYFETASEKYNFLNLMAAVAYGHRLATGPVYSVFEIL
jgi:hypothetical protein